MMNSNPGEQPAHGSTPLSPAEGLPQVRFHSDCGTLSQLTIKMNLLADAEATATQPGIDISKKFEF